MSCGCPPFSHNARHCSRRRALSRGPAVHDTTRQARQARSWGHALTLSWSGQPMWTHRGPVLRVYPHLPLLHSQVKASEVNCPKMQHFKARLFSPVLFTVTWGAASGNDPLQPPTKDCHVLCARTPVRPACPLFSVAPETSGAPTHFVFWRAGADRGPGDQGCGSHCPGPWARRAIDPRSIHHRPRISRARSPWSLELRVALGGRVQSTCTRRARASWVWT